MSCAICGYYLDSKDDQDIALFCDQRQAVRVFQTQTQKRSHLSLRHILLSILGRLNSPHSSSIPFQGSRNPPLFIQFLFLYLIRQTPQMYDLENSNQRAINLKL